MNRYLLVALLAWFGTPLLAAPEALQVTVEAPSGIQGPSLVWDQNDKNSHFHVLLTNITDTPQHIWQDWTSWGWFNLRMEFTDASGGTTVAKKLGHIWYGNTSIYWTLAPHEVHVFDVYYADSELWEGFPSVQNTRKFFTVRAIYESSESVESKAQNVWRGKVVSEPANILLISDH